MKSTRCLSVCSSQQAWFPPATFAVLSSLVLDKFLSCTIPYRQDVFFLRSKTRLGLFSFVRGILFAPQYHRGAFSQTYLCCTFLSFISNPCPHSRCIGLEVSGYPNSLLLTATISLYTSRRIPLNTEHPPANPPFHFRFWFSPLFLISSIV